MNQQSYKTKYSRFANSYRSRSQGFVLIRCGKIGKFTVNSPILPHKEKRRNAKTGLEISPFNIFCWLLISLLLFSISQLFGFIHNLQGVLRLLDGEAFATAAPSAEIECRLAVDWCHGVVAL